MELHIFKCSRRELRAGITADSTGANLPKISCQGGAWEPVKVIDIKHGHPTGMGLATADVILNAISKDGYYINDTIIEITETVMPL